ncbi:DUF255 domain-containing protein [Methylomonas sp. MgM2]
MTLSDSLYAATNKLIDSSSPYLLQHAHNPVDWYPWGEEAFAKARNENKPILLSIGYSTCYWCHVMEREVFENPEVAKVMNQSVVSIKIDREQRPDLDEIYMTATQIMTQRGGWPNNVFVTPDLKPFFAGTYFPPADFTSVVRQIHDLWTRDQALIEAQADRLASAIAQIKRQENETGGNFAGPQEIDALVRHYADYYDNRLGGFYQAPKFPNEVALLFLLDAYRLTDNKPALDMVRGTLEAMAQGGIHDPVGGGFHRYATDAQWRIPHFEKMLYNQALLGRAYTEIYALSNWSEARAVAEGIFDFTLRQMTLKDGGFCSALDAETDAVEGAYYAWTEKELHEALDKESYAWLMDHYGLAAIPEIPGHKHTDGKVLYLKQALAAIAKAGGQPYEDAIARQQSVMAALRKVRDKRKLPYVDDKIVTAWNGLMIDALARAGQVMGKAEYTRAAGRAADFLLANLQKNDSTFYRTWRNGKAEIAAYFEDYAFLIQGLVSTYRATEDDKYLHAAKALVVRVGMLFLDAEHGGYYFTDGSERLLVRTKNALDSALPSGNAVMAHALLDLYEVTGNPEWKQQAEGLLKAFGQPVKDNPRGYVHMMHALLRLIRLTPEQQESQRPIEPPAREEAAETKTHVRVSVSVSGRTGNSLTVTAALDIAEGWHINANPASLDFLIPTAVDVRESSGKARVKPAYPEALAMTTPLGQIKVYKGELRIPVQVTLPGDVENLRLIVRAQACKEAICLAPSDWIIPLTLK